MFIFPLHVATRPPAGHHAPARSHRRAAAAAAAAFRARAVLNALVGVVLLLRSEANEDLREGASERAARAHFLLRLPTGDTRAVDRRPLYTSWRG